MPARVDEEGGDRSNPNDDESHPEMGSEPGPASNVDAEGDPWDLESTAGAAQEAGGPAPEDEGALRRESAKPAGRKPTFRPSFSRAVDLATLLDRDMPLAWFEAVAIAQEVCAVSLASHRKGVRSDLEPGDVAITREGSVEVRGLAQGQPTVAQVARVLLALLGEAKTLPVQLRLLALEEVAPTPTSASLADWSARLALFERPGRQRTIQEVYERFVRTPVPQAEARPKEPVRVKPARPAGPRWWQSRRLRSAAASVALLVAAGLAAAWLWPVVAPMLTGGAQGQPTEPGGAAPPGLSEAAVERIRAAARRIWAGSDIQPPAAAPDAAIAAQPLLVVVPAEIPSVPPASAPAPSRGSEEPAGARAAAPDVTVYSGADTAVVPPSLVRPRLPTRAATGAREENLPLVELLVLPTGEVESVKLLTQPAGVMSAMMLSAIKTWRFEPATRDGRPVRYRLRVRLTNQ